MVHFFRERSLLTKMLPVRWTAKMIRISLNHTESYTFILAVMVPRLFSMKVAYPMEMAKITSNKPVAGMENKWEKTRFMFRQVLIILHMSPRHDTR